MEIENKSRYESFNLAGSQAGQAMVEYLLILVVTVAVVGGLAAQFFTPFKTFVSSSLGTYTQCLLETGEVPRLSGESNIQEDPSECGMHMGEKGSMGLSNGHASNGSSGNGSSGNRGNKSANSEKSESGRGGSGGRGGKSSSLSSRGQLRSGSSSAEGASNKAGKTQNIAIQTPQSGGTFKSKGSSVWDSQNGGYGGTRQRVIDSQQLSMRDREILKKKAQASARSRAISSEDFKPPVKKVHVKPPERKPSSLEDGSETGFQFGTYIRIFLIIIILLVLLIVLGGQAYRLSKSWEK